MPRPPIDMRPNFKLALPVAECTCLILNFKKFTEFFKRRKSHKVRKEIKFYAAYDGAFTLLDYMLSMKLLMFKYEFLEEIIQ
jgi:hypothetical protein